MKKLAVKVGLVLALVVMLLGGIALSHPVGASSTSAHPMLACGGEVYLPPCV